MASNNIVTPTANNQVVKRPGVKKTISGRKSRVRIPEWVTLNVGGTKFMTRREHFKAFPDALLGKELTVDSPHYNRITGEFMFDRNPAIFQYILDYYRTGELHFPHEFCGPTIKKELYYWAIDENDISPCCWSRYKEFDEQKKTLDTLGKSLTVVDHFEEQSTENVVLQKVGKLRKSIYYFFEDPTSSMGAKLWAILYFLIIITSVTSLVLESVESFRVEDLERILAENITLVSQNKTVSAKKFRINTTKPIIQLIIVDVVVNSIFAIDLLLRLITCPNKLRFFHSITNWLDVVVVTSSWVCTGIFFLKPNYYEYPTLLSTYNIAAVIRVARIFLIFKLARHYLGLRILLLALKASMTELLLLVVFIMIGMIIFSTLIFFAEMDKGDKDHFGDIPIGFWWAIVTMTTVGYGDVHPLGGWGFFVGALCAITGMLATGLPIPIIGNNFALYYSVAQLKERMDSRHEKPGLLSIKSMKQKLKKLADDVTDASFMKKVLGRDSDSDSEYSFDEEDEDHEKKKNNKDKHKDKDTKDKDDKDHKKENGKHVESPQERLGGNEGVLPPVEDTTPVAEGKVAQALRKIEEAERPNETPLLDIPLPGMIMSSGNPAGSTKSGLDQRGEDYKEAQEAEKREKEAEKDRSSPPKEKGDRRKTTRKKSKDESLKGKDDSGADKVEPKDEEGKGYPKYIPQVKPTVFTSVYDST